MKLTRPFFSRAQFNKSSSATDNNTVQSSGANMSPRPSSFGEKRSQDTDSRYQKALDERQKLVRAQYASDDDELKEVYQMRSSLLDRKIRRMEDEMKDNGSR